MADEQYKYPLLQQIAEQGLINAEQAAEVVEEHERSGRAIRDLLTEMQVVTEHQVLEVMGSMLGADVVNLNERNIPLEVIKSIPASVARMYNVVPIEMDAHSVKLATFDLLSPQVVDELTFVLTRDVTFAMANKEDIQALLARFFGDDSDSVADMLSALETEIQSGELVDLSDKYSDTLKIEEAANATPVIRFVNLVLYQAVKDQASDIHFEPFEHEFKIRYRVDGALYEMAPPPKQLALPVISRIKVISGLNIAERRLPQDGRIQINIGGREIDFRVSTLPTQYGESLVLRVLDRNVVSLDLSNLGMDDQLYQNMVDDIQKPNGIIVVTGPTGSGKTTTLYSALRYVNSTEVKILTAEEPVEYDIDGLVQVPVNEKIGVTFAKVLRAFLRQDPDVIMVGEIRDLETAEIAIQASLTGHLVFSTLHTNDAPGAITRLIDMNVEPFLISSTLESVLAQRLVRTCCKHCKTPYQPDDDVLERLGLSRESVGERPFYYGAGCAVCNGSGYKGRRGIYEYMRITNAVRELISLRKPSLVIKNKAVEQGMRTLREDGIRAILDGYSTVEEILKYT